MLVYFIPVFVLGGILLLLGVFALLGRVRGGRYVRPIVNLLAKVPFIRRLMERASRAALERSNPDLASAIRKLERSGATRDPARVQVALSRLTAAERRAYMEAAGELGAGGPQPVNRALRRRAKRMR